MLCRQCHPPNQIMDEKVVLHATDKLIFNCDGAAIVDISYNYIIQDWT